MKIERPILDTDLIDLHIHDLELLLSSPTSNEIRPCPDCDLLCADCGSLTCTCMCNSDCKHSAEKMSSEGDRYPIEKRILPLVFAFYSLRICQPCWSCEGHIGTDGKMKRIPQVWFFSKSLLYVRLVDEYVRDLKFHKKLRCTWQVSVTFSDRSSTETAFAIKPDLNFMSQVALGELHKDVAVISQGLVQGIKDLAKEYLEGFKACI